MAQVQAPSKVPRWGLWEATMKSRHTYRNPFTEVSVTATFRSPSGRQIVVDGFYDGGNEWRVRFMPDEIGRWRWFVRTEPPDEGMVS